MGNDIPEVTIVHPDVAELPACIYARINECRDNTNRLEVPEHEKGRTNNGPVPVKSVHQATAPDPLGLPRPRSG